MGQDADENYDNTYDVTYKSGLANSKFEEDED